MRSKRTSIDAHDVVNIINIAVMIRNLNRCIILPVKPIKNLRFYLILI